MAKISIKSRGVIDLERKHGDADALIMEITKRAKQAQLRGADGQLLRRQTVRTGGDKIAWMPGEAVVAAPAKKIRGRAPKAVEADVSEVLNQQHRTRAELTGTERGEKYAKLADGPVFAGVSRDTRIVQVFYPVVYRVRPSMGQALLPPFAIPIRLLDGRKATVSAGDGFIFVEVRSYVRHRACSEYTSRHT